MIIVSAAVAGQSVVKLYAAAMFPGFFLALLYLVYIVGWAMLRPQIAPALPEEQTRVPVPPSLRKIQAAYSNNLLVTFATALVSPGRALSIETEDGKRITYWMLIKDFVTALVPFMLTAGTLALVWWYVVIHQQVSVEAAPESLQPLGGGFARKGAPPAAARPAAGVFFLFVVVARAGGRWAKTRHIPSG